MKKSILITIMHVMMISISVSIAWFVGVAVGILIAIPCAFFLCYMELLAFNSICNTFSKDDPKATRITREVYYKPIKLPAKPRRKTRK